MDAQIIPVTLCNKPMSYEFNDIYTIRRNLKKAYRRLKKHGGWRAVGKAFGISGGMAFRIAEQDYEPRDPSIRARLRLPSLVEVPACPVCGQVHIKKGCPQSNANRQTKSIADWSIDRLKWALENREEMK